VDIFRAGTEATVEHATILFHKKYFLNPKFSILLMKS